MEVYSSNKPEYPKFPSWAVICGWGLLAILMLGKWLLNIEASVSILLAVPLVVIWSLGSFIHFRALKRYEILNLRWRISSAKRTIEACEIDLKEGQPWFDDDDPSDWVFDQKYTARRMAETIETLEEELEQKLQSI